MIPKTIHYFWAGSDTMPENLRKYITSWQKFCPDYELRLWTPESFADNCPRWIRQAIDAKKYAFAADYARAYALYHFGGIYLDTDVEVIRPFDHLLHLPYAFGRESEGNAMETGTFLSEKGNPMFKALLDYYDSRPFIKPDGTPDMLAIPRVIDNVTRGRFRIVDINSPEEFGPEPPDTTIYRLPKDFFSPIDLQTMKLTVTGNTVTIHPFVASWKPASFRFKKKIQRAIGPGLTLFIIKIKNIFRK